MPCLQMHVFLMFLPLTLFSPGISLRIYFMPSYFNCFKLVANESAPVLLLEHSTHVNAADSLNALVVLKDHLVSLRKSFENNL